MIPAVLLLTILPNTLIELISGEFISLKNVT